MGAKQQVQTLLPQAGEVSPFWLREGGRIGGGCLVSRKVQKPQSRAGWPGFPFVELARSVVFRSATQNVLEQLLAVDS
jgi:hypothetical protein